MFFNLSLFSQLDNSFYTGAKGNQLDSFRIEQQNFNLDETENLLDKTVDPTIYFVGPGDVILITINKDKPIQIKSVVSADGILSIKGIGSIKVDGQLLEQVYRQIELLASKTFNSIKVQSSLYSIKKFKVTVFGEVVLPGTVSMTSMDRVSEAISKAGGMNAKASIRHINLIRTTSNGEKTNLNIDLLKFNVLRAEDSNPYLMPGDLIIVPRSDGSSKISIYGEVRNEGEFEFVKGDRLSDLINFSNGLLYSANFEEIMINTVGESLNSSKRINLSELRNKKFPYTLKDDIQLESNTTVFVAEHANFTETSYAVVTGEVKNPGKYPIRQNETKLLELFRVAGGINDNVELEDIEFFRQEKYWERDYDLEALNRMNQVNMSEEELNIFRIKNYERKGLFTVDFEEIINNPDSDQNLTLRNKDSLHVPARKDYISVQGRVNSPGLIKYNPNYNLEDYITLAGGYGFRADKSSVLIKQSKGKTYLAEDFEGVLRPGDIILIPEDKEIDYAEILTVVTQIFTIVAVIISVASR